MAVDIESLTARFGRTLGSADALLSSAGLWRPLLTLLARGEPVSVGTLVVVTGHTAEQVRDALAAQPDTEYDERGDIIGYGITLKPIPYRFAVDGRDLYTWCALDTLMFPAVIGRSARVDSLCQATGQPVHVEVGPDRITGLDPARAVVSLLTPDQCSSVRAAFCDQVQFFASPEAAGPWLADHPESTVLDVAEASALGRRLATSLMTGPDGSGC